MESLTSQFIKVYGKYNQRKLDVLTTIYYYTMNLNRAGLTLKELVLLTGASYDYLKVRLPKFSNSGGTWKNRYLLRGTVERNNRAVFIYSLSSYGRNWLEEKIPRDMFNQTVTRLGPLWRIK